MAESKKVGQVNFEVRADTSKVAADMEAARAEAERVLNQPSPPPPPPPTPINPEGRRPQTPENVEDEHRKSVGRFRTYIGLFSAVAASGIAAGAAIAKVWDDFFTSGTEKATRFKEAIDLSDKKGSITALQSEYEKLTNQLSKSLEGGLFNRINTLLSGNTTQSLKEQVAEIQATLARQREAAAAEQRRLEREEQAAKEKAEQEALAKREAEEIKSAQKRVEAARIAMMGGEERILAEEQRDQQELADKINATKNEALRDQLFEESFLRQLQLQKDLEAVRTTEAEKKKASDERLAAETAAQEREIQRASEMWNQYVRQQSQALKDLRDQNNQLFSAGNVDANAGNIGLILTTLSAQMAGITESLVQSVKTSPYE